MKVNAHLGYSGQCEEAFHYYEKHLGGEITRLMRYEGSPAESMMPADMVKKVIHAQIQIGETKLMGADASPQHFKEAHGIAITLEADTPEDAVRMFGALADGGSVQMPMEKTFFAKKFGALRDRFGIPWMVICE
jgi:PhnB protein